MGCNIIGTGKAVPTLCVTNDDLSSIVDTDNEWIVTRTGIHSRHIAQEETATDLASEAARKALDMAPEGLHDAAQSIDLLICMTITPDAVIPSQAALVKERLGLRNAIAFDLNAACSGCAYGLVVAESMMAASAKAAVNGNAIRRALVIGVERLSRIVNWSDRATCVLFGDGAGCALLEWSESASGIKSSFLKNTDDTDATLTCKSRYFEDAIPFISNASPFEPDNPDYFIGMEGQKVFKFATSSIVEAIEAVLQRAHLGISDISCIVPHQANERIIKYAAKKLGQPLELFQLSIADTGNTSAASALMALHDAYASGKVQPGDNIILVGFGGGLTAGAVLFQAS